MLGQPRRRHNTDRDDVPIPRSDFGARVNGYLQVSVAGNYALSTISDDGSLLYVDGTLVVNNNFFQGATMRSGTVFLSAGKHSFDLEYFQGGGGSTLALSVPPQITLTSASEPAATSIPEPAAFMLTSIGLIAALLRKRRHWFPKQD